MTKYDREMLTDAAEQVSRAVGGGEDYSGVSFRDLLGNVTKGLNVRSLARETLRFYADCTGILCGFSDREIPAKDPRFADAAWRENPGYRRLALLYLAFSDAVNRLAEAQPHWRERERAKFLAGILTSAMSPTNMLLGNPAALKRALDTGGRSLMRGFWQMLTDIAENGAMPRQVNTKNFRVGQTLAATPGAVVMRNDMLELLQYQPTTGKVREIPTLLIVPPIGKYYFMDLAPKRSFTEFAVSQGFQVFITSWRNPSSKQSDWGLDEYVQSCLDAIDGVTEITGSKKVNILGLCAGGIISTLVLNYLIAKGDRRINAASFGVMLLDFASEAPIGAFNARPVISAAKRRSATKGILPAKDLARVFDWMRPNDLVWNYWVNNYLLGNDPPSFDILAWSTDGTNLPGALHSQFLDIYGNNALVRPGALKVLGVPIKLKRINIDTLVTGALTDHLTPWKACYRTTQLLGGNSTFVLSNAGHIASLVNPPGNPKATYCIGPKPGPNPDQWLRRATKHEGTWWSVWADWSASRSGAEMDARNHLGSDQYPVLCAAPGRYVMGKA